MTPTPVFLQKSAQATEKEGVKLDPHFGRVNKSFVLNDLEMRGFSQRRKSAQGIENKSLLFIRQNLSNFGRRYELANYAELPSNYYTTELEEVKRKMERTF